MELVEKMENELVEEIDLRDETEMTFDEVRKKWDKLVWKRANELKKTKKTTFSIEELHSFGLVGLWKAYDAFDPKKGSIFKTFAFINITGHILNEINFEKQRIFGLSRSNYKRKEEVASLLNQKEDNNWTWEQTRERSGLTNEEWIEAVEWNKEEVSIYKKIDIDGNEKELIDFIPADLGIEEKFYQKEMVESIMSKLDEFEQDVIHLRFFQGNNIEQTAKILQMARTTYFRKEKLLLNKIKQQNGSLHM
ncbi:sigma-70 family RNA polymerase sigma factor [[Brevibacterium] frigoritolerans]|nr:sigma-70 family RNA polymerase sigma factor [Peribacillus frigoritolerans]